MVVGNECFDVCETLLKLVSGTVRKRHVILTTVIHTCATDGIYSVSRKTISIDVNIRWNGTVSKDALWKLGENKRVLKTLITAETISPFHGLF